MLRQAQHDIRNMFSHPEPVEGLDITSKEITP